MNRGGRGGEGGLELADEFVLGVGLGHEAGQARPGEARGHFGLGVTAGEDDADPGIEAAQFGQGFFAIQPGHGEVQNDDIDLRAMFLEAVEGFPSVRGEEDLETETFQEAASHGADGFFVVDQEDGAGSAPGWSGLGGAGGRG